MLERLDVNATPPSALRTDSTFFMGTRCSKPWAEFGAGVGSKLGTLPVLPCEYGGEAEVFGSGYGAEPPRCCELLCVASGKIEESCSDGGSTG